MLLTSMMIILPPKILAVLVPGKAPSPYSSGLWMVMVFSWCWYLSMLQQPLGSLNLVYPTANNSFTKKSSSDIPADGATCLIPKP